MLREIINLNYCVVVCFVLIFVIGCENSADGESWKTFKNSIEEHSEEHVNDNKVTIYSLREILDTHFDLMKKVVDLCGKYPEIRRVGVKDQSVTYYKNVLSSSNDLDHAVEFIESALSDIGASSVSCERRGDHEGNPLSDVSFVLYASGLSVSGEVKKIGYETEWSIKSRSISIDKLRDLGFTFIEDKSGWYIYESEGVQNSVSPR